MEPTLFHPWSSPAPILSDGEFQCYNDPVWRVAKMSRMMRQLQALVHTWKDLATQPDLRAFARHSALLQNLTTELSIYARESATSMSVGRNEWPHFALGNYTHTDIALAFQSDANLADCGVENAVEDPEL